MDRKMTKILVTNRSGASVAVIQHDVNWVISLVDVDSTAPFFGLPRDRHLLLRCEDEIDVNVRHAPRREQVEMILEFAERVPDDETVLVHCEAGVSRSTAAALVVLVNFLGVDNIDQCIDQLLLVRPQACPNPVIVHFADEILNCGGKLFAKSEEVAVNTMNRRYQEVFRPLEKFSA